MKLLREDYFESKPEIQVLEEGGIPTKSHYLSGTFMQAETVNKNNRIYSRPILERELIRYNRIIAEKKAASMGELGHPDSPTINLDKVSHRFTEMHFDGNNVVGKAHILDTPNGRIVKTLIDEGIVPGMSSRGLGSVKTEGNVNRVQEDFHLATIDIVADPSAPDAFVSGIMENREWILRDGIWTEMQLENAQKQLRQVTRKQVEETALLLWKNFVTNIVENHTDNYKPKNVNGLYSFTHYEHPNGSFIQIKHGKQFYAIHQDHKTHKRTTFHDFGSLKQHINSLPH